MALTKVNTGGIAADAVDNTILKLDENFDFTGSNTFSGATRSSVGQSIVPEFIDNIFLASNTASSVELQNCFSTTYSVYRLIGVVGGRFAGESNVRFTFLTGTNTAETQGQYGVIRHHDDSSASGYILM